MALKIFKTTGQMATKPKSREERVKKNYLDAPKVKKYFDSLNLVGDLFT